MALNQSHDNRPTFLVWDSGGQPPEGNWIPVLWRCFGEGGGTNEEYSIPRRVEEYADALRARFLGWVHDLGEAQIDGRRLIDRLELRPGLSYWWMTLLVEKDYGKSTRLVDAVKLLALEDLVGVHSAGRIILASGDKTLARAFRLWCGNAGLAFELRGLKGEADPISLMRRLYRLLPLAGQAAVFLLRYLRKWWPLRQGRKFSLSTSGSRVTFVDYLIHLGPNSLATGQFASNYWTDLIGVLEADGVRVNWLHHYVGHELVPKPQQARDLVIRFNQNGAGIQSHTTLDRALGWSVIRGAVRDYGRIVLMGLRLRKVRCHFRPADSKVDLWPLFEQDWRNSMFGTPAISNCLVLSLFERTLKYLPRQELGVYLQENQGWEMAFVNVWKAAGHGRLIGVPHATIRYWDLRYFFDPRSYQRTGKNELPLPDFVALNGSAAIAACRQGGYPEEQIMEVEALRYLYLANLRPVKSDANGQSRFALRVLVLGDYLPSSTRQQMRWLASAAPSLPADTSYIVRPHPNCPVKASDYPSLELQITGAPLEELLDDCDVAFSSNITSAAVDAYCMGVRLVSVLDGDAFNMSPLRGLAGVRFVTSPEELAEALLSKDKLAPGFKRAEYFTIDPALPRWKALLSQAVNKRTMNINVSERPSAMV